MWCDLALVEPEKFIVVASIFHAGVLVAPGDDSGHDVHELRREGVHVEGGIYIVEHVPERPGTVEGGFSLELRLMASEEDVWKFAPVHSISPVRA